MNFFFRELFHNARLFWTFAVFMSLWGIAIVDAFSYALGGSLFSGRMFKLMIVLTVGGALFALIIWYTWDLAKRKRAQSVTETAARVEPALEAEIRQRAAADPGFATECWQCHYFNEDLRVCQLDLNNEYRREIRIEGRKYCLYWVLNGETPIPAGERRDL